MVQPLPAGSRATWQADHQINDLLIDENLDMVERLRGVADELGTTLPVLSMAWILQHPEISSVIAGASKPGQLENILDAHDLVQMSCVIGVPDSLKMQKVKAFVMLKPGLKPCDEYRDILMAYCRKNIAKYAMPYEIEFREQLPKTLVGKVAYRVLEEEEINRLNGEKKNEA